MPAHPCFRASLANQTRTFLAISALCPRSPDCKDGLPARANNCWISRFVVFRRREFHFFCHSGTYSKHFASSPQAAAILLPKLPILAAFSCILVHSHTRSRISCRGFVHRDSRLSQNSDPNGIIPAGAGLHESGLRLIRCADAQGGRTEVRIGYAFHWPLEFPDVFVGYASHRGFSAVDALTKYEELDGAEATAFFKANRDAIIAAQNRRQYGHQK
jgi:hypothetical protein